MSHRTHLVTGLAALCLLAGCGGERTSPDTAAESADNGPTAAAPAAEAPAAPGFDAAALRAALDAQPDAVQARYRWRHPAETLEFFDIAPGMTVVEGLPGGGWYSKILIDYLGSGGTLIGVDYALDMFPLFGMFSDEQLEKKKTWAADWVRTAEGWRDDDDAAIEAFVFGSRDPERFTERADAVLMVRALHNLARFEDDGGFLTQALADAYAVLKPGGVLGVVQHEARPDMPDAWADGNAGYLKRDAVIAAAEAAGFEFVAASDVNANPADQPTTDDFVWRLPPTLGTSSDDPGLRAKLVEIGESNRMTLKFVKPARP